MRAIRLVARSAGMFLLILGSVPAQGGDPMEEIKEIFRRVEQELDEIDQLLLNAATEKAAGKMGEAAENLQKLLESAKGKQGSVIKGIQEILDKAPQKGKGGGGGGGHDPKQRQPDPKDPDQREETPEPKDDPLDDKEDPPPSGENQPAVKPPPEGQMGDADRSDIDRQWGSLPEYLRAIHSKKGGPPVPAKYRRFVEEFFRQNAKVRD